jgi:hypothetical protein
METTDFRRMKWVAYVAVIREVTAVIGRSYSKRLYEELRSKRENKAEAYIEMEP